jgi:tetratricopeptide (TPR) repeat protein
MTRQAKQGWIAVAIVVALLAAWQIVVPRRNSNPNAAGSIRSTLSKALAAVDTKNWPEAERLFLQAEQQLAADGNANNEDGCETASMLAIVYEKQNRPADAVMYYRKCIALRESQSPRNRDSIAEAWNALGTYYFSQLRFADARPAFESAAANYENQARRALSLYQLSLAHAMLNDRAAAMGATERAHSILMQARPAEIAGEADMLKTTAIGISVRVSPEAGAELLRIVQNPQASTSPATRSQMR